MEERTDWRQVVLILAAGVIGACQIGKVAIAVPLLQEDLGLSLVAIGWIAGAYAAIGVAGGLVAGFVVTFFRIRRVVIAGLLLIALGSAIGAAANVAWVLIFSRFIEGVGFLAMVVSCPPLLRLAVTARHQQAVFTLWATYIPVGAVLMLLAGPAIMGGDWRMLWLFNAVVAALNALALLALRPVRSASGEKPVRPALSDLGALVQARMPLLLSAAFALYAIQYFAMSTFLPTFVVERLGLSLAAAGMFSAVALAANAAGNLFAGYLLSRGMKIWQILVFVFGVVIVGGMAVFSALLPGPAIALAACLTLGLAALLPSTVISSMPHFAATTPRLALGMGMVQQASAIGQMAGPALLALFVERGGWPNVAWLFVLVGIGGVGIAFLVASASRRPSARG